MNKIDLDKIRGEWIEYSDRNSRDGGQGHVAGGNDTIKSIKMVAEKVNEIVDLLNQKL